jgi:hypothetical protein
MSRRLSLYAVLLSLFLHGTAVALVRYDEGRRVVKGIVLLQDYSDPNSYYYLPQFPHLATRSDGGFELLCIKYVGSQSAKDGGLFHALIEFTLPQEAIDELEAELKKMAPAAKIAGPVELMEAVKDGEDGVGSFEIVSSILAKGEGDQRFVSKVVTSGHAPLTPGSKAVVAALLDKDGATLLWNSFTGPTSDVSVSIHGCYEAAVKGYNAVVTAEMSTVYEHFSRVFNQQEGYTKRQLRNIVDDLKQNGTIKVDVFDRSAGLSIKTSDLSGIMDIVVNKLTELMFDAKTGWAKEPDREVAVETNQIQGRQKRGWFSRVFGGTQDTKYYTDDQFVLKQRKDIRTKTFRLDLGKTTTIKVPVHSSGNLGGLYDSLKSDPRYFRVVDLNDPDFQRREIHFDIDGNYLEAFDQLINGVSVIFRKKFGEGHIDMTDELYFTSADIKAGKTVKGITYPRLGIQNADSFLTYEYKVAWALRGEDKILRLPPEEDHWLLSHDGAVQLKPPLQKRVVQVDANRALFKDANIATAVVSFGVILDGKPKIARQLTLRADDAESKNQLAIFHDPGKEAVYRVIWYSKKGEVQKPPEILDENSNYVFLTPP